MSQDREKENNTPMREYERGDAQNRDQRGRSPWDGSPTRPVREQNEEEAD